MRGRENKGPPSADLLVCFPTRAHLALMPKPICSPARPAEPGKYHHQYQHRRNPSRGGASPLLWAKSRPTGSEMITSEPTSPKVTCAGQIKVRQKSSACKNWQSVMEEIERIHNNKRNKKRPKWAEALGFKKDVMQFLACMRRIKFDFRCFGSFPNSEIDSEDEDEEEQEADQSASSQTVFSKWFMVLQEEQNKKFVEKQSPNREKMEKEDAIVEDCVPPPPPPPPPNALLLMRCRSAPAKSWLEEREEEEGGGHKRETGGGKDKGLRKEEGKQRRRSLAMVMRLDTNFCEIATADIAKETWVSGGMADYLSRSRSWKR